ncbi:hypothetical protein SORDD20_01016 [Streptococcus oralis]|nr:hypothetical protein SORDD20_01016 [Streptococcus oralis]
MDWEQDSWQDAKKKIKFLNGIFHEILQYSLKVETSVNGNWHLFFL